MYVNTLNMKFQVSPTWPKLSSISNLVPTWVLFGPHVGARLALGWAIWARGTSRNETGRL